MFKLVFVLSLGLYYFFGASFPSPLRAHQQISQIVYRSANFIDRGVPTACFIGILLWFIFIDFVCSLTPKVSYVYFDSNLNLLVKKNTSHYTFF